MWSKERRLSPLNKCLLHLNLSERSRESRQRAQSDALGPAGATGHRDGRLLPGLPPSLALNNTLLNGTIELSEWKEVEDVQGKERFDGLNHSGTDCSVQVSEPWEEEAGHQSRPKVVEKTTNNKRFILQS